MSRSEGSSVLVTGGARGIGISHVRRFAAEGARVFLGDIIDASPKGKGVSARCGLILADNLDERPQVVVPARARRWSADE